MVESNKFYIICTTPRSGSQLLSQALESTQYAGKPNEYFLPQVEDELVRVWGKTSFRGYLKNINEKCCTSNGVFSSVLMWDQLRYLRKKVCLYSQEFFRIKIKDIINALFPEARYIWLSRQDKIRQGISFWRAMKTNRWNQMAGDLPETERIAFNFHEIDYYVERLKKWDSNWSKFFHRSGITPLEVTYETNVAENLVETVKAILDDLEIRTPDDIRIETTFQKMGDTLSDEFDDAYLEEIRKRKGKS